MIERGEWEQYGRPKADFNLFVKSYKDVEEGTVKPFECMKQLGMTKPSFIGAPGNLTSETGTRGDPNCITYNHIQKAVVQYIA